MRGGYILPGAAWADRADLTYQQLEISGSIEGTPNLGGTTNTDVVSGARQSLEGRATYSKYRRLPGGS